MHYLYSIATLVFQSLGQILSLLLGWIIAVHFGRVPARQRYILSAMAGVSLLWLLMALSLTSPWVRAFIATAAEQSVPLYIKLIVPLAGIGWVILPVINGVLSVYLRKERSRSKINPWQILLGYKYTPGFALALILMLVSMPILVLPPILKGLRREHLSIMFRPDDLPRVMKDISEALAEKEISHLIRRQTLWRRSPLAILALFAHDLLGDWTKSNPRMISGTGFKLLVQPTDLIIEGNSVQVIKVRNTLAKALTFTEVYFTWGGEAHTVEERLNQVRRLQMKGGSRGILLILNQIETELDRLEVPFNEWEGLYRQILQLRVDFLSSLHNRTLPVNTIRSKIKQPR